MTATKRKVLVVEDDKKTAELMEVYLQREGYQVLSTHDGRQALDLARDELPDLVLLDLMLPGINGMELCRLLREESGVPIIMVTARSTEMDKLKGLDLGADDYVTKPFSPRELMARVRAVLRRTVDEQIHRGPSQVAWDDRLHIDFAKHQVSVQGQPVHLTPTEFRLLATLIREPGRVFSRGQLIEKVLGFGFEGSDRTIDVHILNLRRKIEPDPNRPIYVKSVYGMGYKFGG